MKDRLEGIRIERLVHGGAGLAHTSDGMVVFVEGGVPAEVVDAIVFERKKGFVRAKVERVLEASPYRVEPRCPNFGVCGGCQWQQIRYKVQVEAKREIVLEQLRRLGGLDSVPRPELLFAEPWRYRRTVRMYVARGTLGFRQRRSHRLVPVESCPVLEEPLNAALEPLQTLMSHVAEGEVRLTGSETGNIAVYFWVRPPCNFFEDLARRILTVDNVVSVFGRCGKTELYLGEHPFELETHLLVEPNSFVQPNRVVNRKMRAWIQSQLEQNGLAGEFLLELFAGAGNFTRELVKVARRYGISRIFAVEGDKTAVECGKANARLWGEANVEWLAQPVNYRILKHLPQKGCAAIVLDPPRSGAKPALPIIEQLLPQVIVSISCDPATHARDLGSWTKLGYRLKALAVADQFPHTFHTETLALLVR